MIDKCTKRTPCFLSGS